jgi:predicted nuclease with RNAse H fold
MGTYLGFDPGGASGTGAFGWAVVSGDKWPPRLVGQGITHYAEDAFKAARDCAGSKITAVGIDAPLFWVSAGDRLVDRTVRLAIAPLGCPHGTVQHVNSLRGACLIQGMLVAMLCRKRIAKGIPLTETHPKALLWLIRIANRERPPARVATADLNDYVQLSRAEQASEHERDAVLSAVAAFAMDSQHNGWHDLYAHEPNAITPLSPPPGYWMPLNPEGGPRGTTSKRTSENDPGSLLLKNLAQYPPY